MPDNEIREIRERLRAFTDAVREPQKVGQLQSMSWKDLEYLLDWLDENERDFLKLADHQGHKAARADAQTMLAELSEAMGKPPQNGTLDISRDIASRMDGSKAFELGLDEGFTWALRKSLDIVQDEIGLRFWTSGLLSAARRIVRMNRDY